MVFTNLKARPCISIHLVARVLRYAPDPDLDLAPISTSVSSLLSLSVLPLSFPLCNHRVTGRGRLAAMTHQPPHYVHHPMITFAALAVSHPSAAQTKSHHSPPTRTLI